MTETDDRPIELGRDPELVTPRMVKRQAQTTPDAPFLQSVDGEMATYRQVDGSARRWADALRRLGVRPGATVATMLRPSFESHYAWLGCGWLGAWEVPVNTMYRGRMLRHVLADSRARVAIVAADLVDRLPAHRDSLPDLDVVVVPGAEPPPRTAWRTIGVPELLEGTIADRTLTPPQPRDIAAVLYTSGTTGPSKGVLVPWAELATGIGMFPADWLGDSPAHYAPLPVYHFGGKLPLTLMAHAGGRVVFRETFSTSSFWGDVVRFGCTSTFMTATVAHFVQSHQPRSSDRDVPLRATNMAPVIEEVDDFKQRFSCRVVGLYGMTEIGWPLFLHDPDAHNWKSCGRARPGYHLRVVDADGDDVGPGVAGELLVRADDPIVMNGGYLNRPEETARAWRDGWFHTGDVLRYDEDGYFYFVDRVKDALRRRGENISSLEVELEVTAHPDVADCAAVAAPSEVGEDEVKVFVVAEPGRQVDPRDLIEFLATRMPRFMVPRYVEAIESLPRTETGKVRKVELRERGNGARTWDREAAGVSLPR